MNAEILFHFIIRSLLMDTPNLYEEIIVFILLLLAIVGIYILLKLHYVFAFGLVQKTSLSEEKKQKIDKIKIYLFVFLKILLFLGLTGMFAFGISMLMEGMSLKQFVLDAWGKIPEGFWLYLLFTLVRIAVLIVVFRYLFKKIFAFLEKQKEKTIAKKVYNSANVKKVYMRFENTIKYTFVLGVVYRITHFFPFLSEVSTVMFDFVVLFFILASAISIREVVLMYQTKNQPER